MSYSKNLNLLLTTRTLVDGGAERVWTALARRFAERGDRVTLAVDEAGDRQGLDETTNPRLLVLGRRHPIALWRLTRHLKNEPTDVAMAAVSGSCVKLVAAAALSGSSARVVVSCHGSQEWRTGRLAAVAYWGMPFVNRRADRIVGVSGGLTDELIRDWGADPARTRCIYNPVAIDLERGRATAADLEARAPIVLAVGRLSPEKGMVDLVEAFARVRRPDARLVIGGDGPEQGRIEAAIAAHGLGSRVTLLGRVDPMPWYARARVVAVPSRTEAFGLVLVEALAHGLPIVATACHGPREILGEDAAGAGRWGQLVPIGDADAMARGIEAALDAPGPSEARLARAADFAFETGFAAWAELADTLAAERAGADTATPPIA